MTDEPDRRKVLYVIVCAAGPAGDVGKLVTLAHQRGWDVQIIATPSALDFIDTEALEAQTGRPVRSEYRKPGEPRSPKADAIIVAPATYNTINKWANGISDTYALGILAEAPGLGIPVVVLPFVNTALANRAAFQRSMNTLCDEGARVLLGPGKFEPHPPRSGTDHLSEFPWHLALRQADRAVRQSSP
ncbi:flavoprotein [Actinomadura livida]|uniref:Flavoprotein n=1 Tax=Actinomadura livida TaxID=79909 RepID=A0A7W7IAW2_9ACTN|nr:MULTISPECIES: flavoprotein [Actinomadura]MBB4773625.1 phosphopantothenoylcysteine synthetase/decarboxylase [Actinomadura catellatispora]GGU09598.1 flavoprotein [Actinomadura livida]